MTHVQAEYLSYKLQHTNMIRFGLKMLTKWHPPKPASSPLWPCPRPVLPQLWCKCRETIWDHAKGPQAYSFVWFCQVFTRIFSGYRVTIGLSLPRGCYWHPSFVVALQGRVVQHHPRHRPEQSLKSHGRPATDLFLVTGAKEKRCQPYGSVSKPCTPGEHQNSW